MSPPVDVPSEARMIRWRRQLLLAFLLLLAGYLCVRAEPIRTIETGELGIRTNEITGAVTESRGGWMLVVPKIHRLLRYPLRDQIYRSERSLKADGEAPYQSVEGLSFGLELTIRYALDPERVAALPLGPEEVSRELIEPLCDGIVRRTFARRTIREIFSAERPAIEREIERELAEVLAKEGVVLKAVLIGNVDLPAEYKTGLEHLLAEELASEKMRFTLELKAKQVKQTDLEAEADKVKRERSAEAAGEVEVIAAKARAEAMKHLLPFKEKEIEARALEAEASRAARIKDAESSAEARRIEAAGEADSRKKLAEADAYRTELAAKAASDALARDSKLIAQNPLLIQKTLADKLSDKISVIIAPPAASGFFASQLIGAQGSAATPPATPAPSVQPQEQDLDDQP